MLKYLKIALVAATLVANGTVFALELQDAKNAGWLGEQRDGAVDEIGRFAQDRRIRRGRQQLRDHGSGRSRHPHPGVVTGVVRRLPCMHRFLHAIPSFRSVGALAGHPQRSRSMITGAWSDGC